MSQDLRNQLVFWMEQVQTTLSERGAMQSDGGIRRLPSDIEDELDGFIENSNELLALIKIAGDARDGRYIPPLLLQAAHLMAAQAYEALSDPSGV